MYLKKIFCYVFCNILRIVTKKSMDVFIEQKNFLSGIKILKGQNMHILSSFLPKINVGMPKGHSYTNNYANYPNLAPLKCDTVSFCGNNEEEIDKYQYGVTLKTARMIYEDALPSENYLRKQLTSIFGDMTRQKPNKGSGSKPIYAIKYRTKTPASIIEKSKDEKLNNFNEVKENLHDIVGARIVMSDASVEKVDEVIDRITKAVEENKIKILQIENYRPEPELDINDNPIKKFDYASAGALKRLRDACNEKGCNVEKNDRDKSSGYMAIHLSVQLPNGYIGEIQIMGGDVEDLKEVEDLCYKVKAGKSINKKYDKMVKIMTPLKNKDDLILQKAYQEYTRRAYLYQREKEPLKNNRKAGTPTFLPIPEDLNYIPKKLDFNNLYLEKQKCDEKSR